MAGIALGQSIKEPWWVVDQAGGKSTSGDVVLQASVGQPAIQRMFHLDSGKVLESGYIPGLRDRSGASTIFGLNVAASWNMISVPVLVNDYNKATIFPTSTSHPFYFNNGYIPKDTLQKGLGYWLKFPSSQTVNVQGTSLFLDVINVNAQWNMIGTISYPVLTTDVTPVPPVTIQSYYFGFTPSVGYTKVDTLKPGYAYWVKVNTGGMLLVESSSVLLKDKGTVISANRIEDQVSDAVKTKEEFGLQSITITNAENCQRQLYFSAKQTNIDLAKYELPPTPPSQIFDVRFESQRNLEVFKNNDGADVKAFPIKITGAKYPLTINWKVDKSEEQYYTLEAVFVEDSQLKSKEYKSSADGKIVISDPKLVSLKLLVTPMATIELPKEFSLYQNYPNPFNPTTMIKYNLPVTTTVKLVIYNILGQVVTTIVDGVQEAGYKSVEWSTNNFSSGVYFYKLTAGDYVETKKMLLIR
jgi:hypothetical protein